MAKHPRFVPTRYVARALGIPAARVVEMVEAAKLTERERALNRPDSISPGTLEYMERMKKIRKGIEQGLTLQRIAELCGGITRERVRQLANKMGLTAQTAVRARTKLSVEADAHERHVRHLKRDERYRRWLGCSYDEAMALNQNLSMWHKGSRAWYFNQHQRTAINNLGAKWNLTFPQWWKLWDDSGKWEERGRGTGYFLMRFNRHLPYELGNVRVVRGNEGFKALRRDYPWPLPGAGTGTATETATETND